MNPALEIGKTFGGGRYVVEQVLGIGGFGITYYVRHIELGVHYAIKEFFISGKCVRESDRSTVLLQNINQSRYDKLKKRFADEARTLVALNNPHVVKVIDIFEENNTSYIVMEYVPGITLQQKVDNEGKMSVPEAINCMGQLAEAVAYIHDKGILHRDIKPDNVMITPDNRVVLVDFGSAREFVNDEIQNQTAIVTQGYAPTEQYAVNGKKGNYTDIYAMGGVFYFALTGKKPMDAFSRTQEEMKSPKELNSDVSDEVNNTIMKAMAMKPEDRYQTVHDFMIDLVGKQATSGEVMSSSVQQGKGKKKALPIVMAILTISVVVVVAMMFQKSKDEEEREIVPATENDTVEDIQVPIYHLSTGEEYTYEGELDSLGVPNGYGTATFADRVYVGNFKNGNMNGSGELTLSSGTMISTIFTDNLLLDSCYVRKGVNEYFGYLSSDFEYEKGYEIDASGTKYDYENGTVVSYTPKGGKKEIVPKIKQ